MGKTSLPTPFVAEPLEKMGIIPPPTWIACSNLSAWLRCNTTEETEKRRKMIREAQQAFIGKRVSHRATPNKYGMALYIYKRYRTDAVDNKNPLFAHPLDAMVKWDTERVALPSALSSIEVVEDETRAVTV